MIAEPYICIKGPWLGEIQWHYPDPNFKYEWQPYAVFEREKLKELGGTIERRIDRVGAYSLIIHEEKMPHVPVVTKEYCSNILSAYGWTDYESDSESSRLLNRAKFLQAVCAKEGVKWLQEPPTDDRGEENLKKKVERILNRYRMFWEGAYFQSSRKIEDGLTLPEASEEIIALMKPKEEQKAFIGGCGMGWRNENPSVSEEDIQKDMLEDIQRQEEPPQEPSDKISAKAHELCMNPKINWSYETCLVHGILHFLNTEWQAKPVTRSEFEAFKEDVLEERDRLRQRISNLKEWVTELDAFKQEEKEFRGAVLDFLHDHIMHFQKGMEYSVTRSAWEKLRKRFL